MQKNDRRYSKIFRLMKTKIFCDSADYETINFFNNKSIVDGFTTNPSLMRISGAKNYRDYSLKILKICKKKPISFEVFADNQEEMLKQAYKINTWGKNVYVKIPVVNSKGQFMGPVIKELSSKGIKLNITAIYSFEQVDKVFKHLDKKVKSIISIFAGRMADKGIDPLPIFKKSIFKVKKYKNIEILWASTREAYNFIQAKQIGCNIITMPPKIINLINSFGKNSNQLTLETVKGFLMDSKKSKFKL
jgi:transaldolase